MDSFINTPSVGGSQRDDMFVSGSISHGSSSYPIMNVNSSDFSNMHTGSQRTLSALNSTNVISNIPNNLPMISIAANNSNNRKIGENTNNEIPINEGDLTPYIIRQLSNFFSSGQYEEKIRGMIRTQSRELFLDLTHVYYSGYKTLFKLILEHPDLVFKIGDQAIFEICKSSILNTHYYPHVAKLFEKYGVSSVQELNDLDNTEAKYALEKLQAIISEKIHNVNIVIHPVALPLSQKFIKNKNALAYDQTGMNLGPESYDVITDTSVSILPQLDVPLRSLGTSSIGRLIRVMGMVTKVSSIIPDPKIAQLRCRKCGGFCRVPIINGRLTIPDVCGSCNVSNFETKNSVGNIQIEHEASKFFDRQTVRIQEAPSELKSGETPVSVNLAITNCCVNKAQPGDKVEVFGILRAKTTKCPGSMTRVTVRSVVQMYIEVLSIRVLKNIDETMSGINKDSLFTTELNNEMSKIDEDLAVDGSSPFGILHTNKSSVKETEIEEDWNDDKVWCPSSSENTEEDNSSEKENNEEYEYVYDETPNERDISISGAQFSGIGSNRLTSDNRESINGRKKHKVRKVSEKLNNKSRHYNFNTNIDENALPLHLQNEFQREINDLREKYNYEISIYNEDANNLRKKMMSKLPMDIRKLVPADRDIFETLITNKNKKLSITTDEGFTANVLRREKNLIHSMAPNIFGEEYDDIKAGLLLQCIGGERKIISGAVFRGELHILLCGDPGTAKSQLLQYIHRVSPRSIYTSGKGSSAVGLTAMVTRDPETREMVLEPGALVLADSGICLCDEFDKLNDMTRSVMLEVMEQQTVSIAKAGVVANLNARTSILAAANPVDSKFNPRKSIVQNLNLPGTILSRFDLVYLMLDDQKNREKNSELANHILQLYFRAQANQKEKKQSQNGQTKTTYENPHLITKINKEGKKRITDVTTLKRYIKCAKTLCHPVISIEAAMTLEEAYIELRKSSYPSSTRYTSRENGSGGYSSVEGRVSALPRQLLSLIRLAEARAKLRFAVIVTPSDVRIAKELLIKALKVSATDSNGIINLATLSEQ